MPNTLWVGLNETYKTLASAVAASAPGDTINLRAGTYTNDFATIRHQPKIVGVDGQATLKATVAPPNGKAILVTQASVEIQNLAFEGSRVPDGNGAGIRHETGNLTIRNSAFRNNENGILTHDNSAGRVVIDNSDFVGNGRGDARTHGVYANKVASLTVTNSRFSDTDDGHHIKSRAASTTVLNSVLRDGPDSSVYSIDVCNGGTAVIRGNTLHKGPASLNKHMIAFGTEGKYGGDSILIENNKMTSDLPNTNALVNWTGTVARFVDNDTSDPDIKLLSEQAFTNSGGSTIAPTPTPTTPSGTVEKSTSYTLGSGEVNLTLTGTSAINGTGNELNNKIVGNSANNTLKGNAGNDLLQGMGGADRLLGDSGADRLEGGDGNDVLSGGTGGDQLLGGNGADRFDFDLFSHSTGAARDQILDFSRAQGDRIDVSGIDANASASYNQAFSFIGGNAFSGAAGQLRAGTVNGVAVIQGDVNGDRVADLRIAVNTASLASTDFVL